MDGRMMHAGAWVVEANIFSTRVQSDRRLLAIPVAWKHALHPYIIPSLFLWLPFVVKRKEEEKVRIQEEPQ